MKVYKLTLGAGSTCVFDNKVDLLQEISMFIDEEEVEPFQVQIIEMTKEEYESLGEFQGW